MEGDKASSEDVCELRISHFPPKNNVSHMCDNELLCDLLSIYNLLTNDYVLSRNSELLVWTVCLNNGSYSDLIVSLCSSDSGAFLVPYFIMMFLCGIPLLLMEFAVGQYTRLGSVHALAKICPLLKGGWPCRPKAPLMWWR